MGRVFILWVISSKILLTQVKDRKPYVSMSFLFEGELEGFHDPGRRPRRETGIGPQKTTSLRVPGAVLQTPGLLLLGTAVFHRVYYYFLRPTRPSH